MRTAEDDILMDLLGSPFDSASVKKGSTCTCIDQYYPTYLNDATSMKLSDSLDEINPTDFCAMEAEFQDLRSFDYRTLLYLYQIEGSSFSEAKKLPDIYTDLESRKRWDSGYSGYSCLTPDSPNNSYTIMESESPFSEFPSPSMSPDSMCGSSAGLATNSKPRSKNKSKDRQLQLWEFLYYLLTSQTTDALKWENQKEGIFLISQPGKIAEMWGAHRNRTNMTYEKMSRTLRYYYSKNLITKVAGKQHTYKFHYNNFP